MTPRLIIAKDHGRGAIFGADFDDREGFTTAWSSEVFGIRNAAASARWKRRSRASASPLQPHLPHRQRTRWLAPVQPGLIAGLDEGRYFEHA
jgi:hypothetical protein